MPRKSIKQEIKSVADVPHFSEPSASGFPSSHQLAWAMSLLLIYFGLRLLFFAVTISPFVPPDEVTHFGLSSIFSEVSFLPENSPDTYPYGLVSNIPYLYYWVMGKLLTVNVFPIPDLLFLRLLNIPLAFATVYFIWRMLRLLTDDRLHQLLLMVTMTNIIMFSFLSAFVTYDNLSNLLAAMAIYSFLAFVRTRSGDLLAVSFLCQLAGSLTKSAFLPLILILNVLLLIHGFRDLRSLPGSLRAYFRDARWTRWGLACGILLGLALTIHLYGGNAIHYGSLTPEMSEVLSPDAAMQNRLEARNLIFSLFKEGRISREQALEMTSQIRSLNDRADAIALIENYEALKRSKAELMGPLEYPVFWVQQMLAGIFGIMAHLAIPNSGLTLLPFAILVVLTGVAILLRWRPSDAAWLPADMMVIAAFYVIFLMYGVNYRTYLSTGAIGLALQGRYLFPVLGPVSVVSSYYLLRLFRLGSLRLGVAATISLLFIAFDFPYFLLHVTSEWFDPLLP